jgi:hypothetical protein
MLDQMQIASVIPSLSALLAHPEFQAGVRDGQQSFQDGLFWDDHEHPWTEQKRIDFVTKEVSAKQHHKEQRLSLAMGEPPISYLHRLGFVMGYLDQELAAQA